jgi:hypothetical protein
LGKACGAGLEKALAQRAASRRLEDLTVGPVLSVTTETMMAHKERLLQIPGAEGRKGRVCTQTCLQNILIYWGMVGRTDPI